MTSFTSIITAAQKAEREFSATRSTEAENAEVLKEMAVQFMSELSNLVHLAGGDNGYIEGHIDGMADDIDHCFRDVVEAREECKPKGEPLVFRPRYGLLRELVKGAELGGRP